MILLCRFSSPPRFEPDLPGCGMQRACSVGRPEKPFRMGFGFPYSDLRIENSCRKQRYPLLTVQTFSDRVSDCLRRAPHRLGSAGQRVWLRAVRSMPPVDNGPDQRGVQSRAVGGRSRFQDLSSAPGPLFEWRFDRTRGGCKFETHCSSRWPDPDPADSVTEKPHDCR